MTTVLLHGLGADRRQPLGLFESVVEDVSDPDELIVAPDVRAHGGFLAVGEPADFELDRLAAEVCTQVPVVIAEAGRGVLATSEPVTIIGISMGAAIALRIALAGRLPVARAVFVRPSFDDRSLPEHLRPFPVIGQVLVDAGPAGVAEFAERALYRRIAAESPAGGRALLAQFQAPDAARRAMRLVEIPRNRAFETDAQLGELAARGIRSLVVGALRDPVHPVPVAERWAGGLGAPMELVPGRDDGPAAQTAALRERVGRWLRGNEPCR
ncbi:alpha/beta fold hydrolase [Agromyces sp. NPDC058484]|uniref:alpha/beta fold hydrolase n=1 Tax=Agromyces sp. NPDC058484 TaxID=3346524 RepID=UPI00364CFDA1